MKLKKQDKIQVLTGKDKGKTGVITKVFLENNKVIADGVNMLNKHQKPRKEGEKGTKIQFASPINASNVMLVCPKCSQPTKIGYTKDQGGHKLRVCKKCKATF